ncbi:hypothetical protein NECAME_05950 [Necator americanus]|uniref:Uncharacterized protein n=1 Tax=Necator americanus TaxID=51031 RepID=W2TX93_NECAM|nr:hypothetical protein NECAME_05950 [Necator americanus]ETN86458.1 hypothetical protein NECAME_05950 [Necator americanus]
MIRVWEYGFYEPEEKRIPKNKLMLIEALEMRSGESIINTCVRAANNKCRRTNKEVMFTGGDDHFRDENPVQKREKKR